MMKENTFLRGALLGYTRRFMNETYEQIIEFAELKGFEDRLFKQLSSGMKSRLAFSIASLVSPDILILDEVLSVGDEGFKDKSARRIKQILSDGVTGILVSHSIEQVRNLCNKVLWLDHGNQIAFGPTKQICNAYCGYLYTPKAKRYLPKNEEELEEASKRFFMAWYLGEKELRAHISYPGESTALRYERLLSKVDSLSKEERAEIQKEIDNR